jgi:hypothetical protein
MPIQNFSGETFVAFIDISGFKRMMRNRKRALDVLELFYRTGYIALRAQETQQHCRLEGIFVTDCAILFVRSHNSPLTEQLRALLQVVEGVNRYMIAQGVMLTTSIAFGHFSYQPLYEFEGIEKNIVFGDAYLSAYLDNSGGIPKLTSGLCRIIVDGIANTLLDHVLHSNDPLFSRLRHRTDNHLYFYWMLNNSRQINRFERNYASPLGITDYPHILKVLQKAAATKSAS